LGRDWLAKIKIDWPQIKSILKLPMDKTVQGIQSKFPQLFDGELGEVKGIEAKLDLKEEAVPKFFKPRPVPFATKTAIADELEALVASGVLKKIDYSDWASPIVPVLKASGKYRICGDFSVTVNKHLKVPEHPMPRVSELLAKLNGGQSFTKLDLSQAYQQLVLDKQSQALVTVNTHLGLFSYTRMPYGISAAPAIFQSVMDKVLQGLECGCYLDDIIVTGRDDKEHWHNLCLVLERLVSYGFKLQATKCEFFKPSIKYLGQVVNREGVRLDEEGTEAIRKAPEPRNKEELRSFLGLVNHYRKFVRNMSSICGPLNQLLEKNRRWEWSKECRRAFRQILATLTAQENLLVHYNPESKLVLAVDASPIGVGAVISHEVDGVDRPIEFASRSLTTAERNYSQIDREALAIVFGVKRFHQYLYGRKFVLWTDNLPLSHIMSLKKGIPSLAAARIQRWCIELAAYSFEVKHRPATKQGHVDALSRLPLPGVEMDEETVKWTTEAELVNKRALAGIPVTFKQIAAGTRADRVLGQVLQFVRVGWPSGLESKELKPYFDRRWEISVEQDCLLWGTRVIVPAKYQQELLTQLHEGHPGIVRMKSLARLHCWWAGIDSEVETTVRKCNVCQKNSALPPMVQNSWAWPNLPWERIHIDFAQWSGEHYLIVVDAHSKWPEVVPMTKGTTAVQTIQAFRELFARWGLPSEVCSDNGQPFQSDEVRKFMRTNGIKQIFSAPYHPPSNGEAERFVRTFKQGMVKNLPDRCSKNHCLQEFLLTYRTTPHTTTGKTPSEMLQGRRVKTKLDLVKPNLGYAIQKKNPGTQYPRCLEVGDRVMARDYRPRKPTWVEGVVLERNTPVTYVVEILVEGAGLRWKRHIDQLKAFDGDVVGTPPVTFQEEPMRILPEEPHTIPDPGVRAPASPRPCVAPADPDEVMLRRSSREKKTPAYLDDYER
jgi:hypothetical protein